MSEFEVIPIEGLEGKVRICKLAVDGECEFDNWVRELEKTKLGKSSIAAILQNLHYVSMGKMLPEEKFRPLKREKDDPYPDFEVKRRAKGMTLRVYLFQDQDDRIIAVVGKKTKQNKDISRLRRIKAEYFESQNQ